MKDKLGLVFAALAGALFGAGLLISGMAIPARVVGFLDVTGHWDPTLMFVMGGAIPVYAIAFRIWDKQHGDAWFGQRLALNTKARIDRRLLFGAAIFGVGWGLGGYCPGPGVVALGAATQTGLVFVGAMLVGMFVEHRLRAA